MVNTEETDEVYDLDLDEIEDVEAATLEALAALNSEKPEKAGKAEKAERAEQKLAEGTERERLEQEVVELRESLGRALADFDNLRKRSEREKDELSRYALTRFLQEVLPVMDNFDRALAAEGSAEDLKAGVDMIVKQMSDLLGSYGVRAVAAEGELFDPTYHEAVARFEDESVAEATVINELQKGYVLGDRLLRPAMVRVAVPPTVEPENETADAEGTSAEDQAEA